MIAVLIDFAKVAATLFTVVAGLVVLTALGSVVLGKITTIGQVMDAHDACEALNRMPSTDMPHADMPIGQPWPPEQPVSYTDLCGCVWLHDPLDFLPCDQHWRANTP